MKKQALAIAIASALAAPSAFAAQDSSGMQYTSAAEGFYASIRARYNSGGSDNAGSSVENSTSRVGIRGSNDLGGGLEGFYNWEMGVNITDGAGVGGTRLGHVGLRGGFGQIQVGSFWTQDYNWTHGSTDVASVHSGGFNYTDQREARSERSIEYTTPDLNGFQGAFLVRMENTGNNGDNGGGDVGEATKDDNDLDSWNLAAQYAIQGFSVAGSYNVITDGISPSTTTGNATTAAGIGLADGATLEQSATEDLTSWTVKLGYAQDNWYVNGWYGVDSSGDARVVLDADGDASTANDRTSINLDDTETFSVAAGVDIDKVGLYAVYETQEVSAAGGGASASTEDARGTVGAIYYLGANSRVWIEYAAVDLESDEFRSDGSANPSRADDYITIGLRHDF